ncbi:hypothetical protein EDE12_11114 [Methylosinus sp. sav-2]|jgi:hypothetical protein|uniref:hypothetical protein n=1 Tax=unclassified Methylosinus TaxID=2624500 RepID=UPI0004664740|nr:MULTISPECIES: hypothetical protein [unclassified Methylosinus]TDX62108.1 hypothetical protein EDE12_11114 [Methylosinus sp. sav-2]
MSKFATLALAVLISAPFAAAPARAVEISPFFPLPNSFDVKGPIKDGVLAQQISWLEDGIAAIEKARAGAAPDKLAELDAQLAAAVKERDILKSDETGRDAELARKNLVVSNINRWINGLARKATEQLKIAILKDGAERDAAERRHIQLSQQADDLEKVKHEPAFEAWGR